MKDQETHQLSTILKRLMIECNVDDARLSQATGVPFTTIARMRANENANPTASSLRPLAKYFGISISQLLGDEPFNHSEQDPHQNESQRLPVVPWDKIITWADNERLNQSDILGWVSTGLPVSAKSFATKVENRGFGAPFNQANTLLIDPAATPVSKDFVLIQLDNHPTILLKEIIFDGDHVYLKSVNPELTQTTLLDTPNYKICGVVIEVRQQYHSESFTKLKPQLESSFNLDQAKQVEFA